MYENVKAIEAGGFSSAVSGFFKGVGIAALFTVIVFFIFALLLSYTPLPQGVIPFISYAAQVIGAVIAGFIPAKRTGTKGILTGAISGIVYMLIIWLLASLSADGFYLDSHIITMLCISLVCGAIGGIFGVNLKPTSNNKKKR